MSLHDMALLARLRILYLLQGFRMGRFNQKHSGPWCCHQEMQSQRKVLNDADMLIHEIYQDWYHDRSRWIPHGFIFIVSLITTLFVRVMIFFEQHLCANIHVNIYINKKPVGANYLKKSVTGMRFRYQFKDYTCLSLLHKTQSYLCFVWNANNIVFTVITQQQLRYLACFLNKNRYLGNRVIAPFYALNCVEK